MTNVEGRVVHSFWASRGARKIVTVCGLLVVLGAAALRWMAPGDPQSALAVEPPAPPDGAPLEEPGADLEARGAAESDAVRSAVASATLRLSVVDEDGRALAGVPIEVFRGSTRQGSRRSDPLLRITSGRQPVEQALAGGTFTVVANRGSGLAAWSEAVAELAVEEGKVATAALRVREPGASLTVRVFDDAGDPVARMPVSVAPASTLDGADPLLASGRITAEPGDLPIMTTSADGTARLWTIDSALLSVLETRQARAELNALLLAEQAKAKQARAQELRAKVDRSQKPPIDVKSSLPTIAGWLDASGNRDVAVTKARLKDALRERSLDLAANQGSPWHFASGRGATQTDGQGMARFAPLFAGDYVVSLTGNGTLSAAVKKGTSQRVTVARRQQATAEFRLPRNGIVVVRVIDAASRHVSPSSEPSRPVKGRIRVTARDKVFDDERATFELGRGELRPAPLPPGHYVASCELSPGLPLVARAPRDVFVRSGQTTEVVVELFEASSAMTGKVVDEDGAPVGGVDVRATPEGYEPKTTRSGPDGSFAIQGLPALPLRVWVDATTSKRKAQATLAWFGTPAQPETFYGGPLAGVTLQLQRGVTLQVYSSRPNGPSTPGAKLRLTPGPTSAPIEVDFWPSKSSAAEKPDRLAEVRNVRRGRYRLEVLGPDHTVLHSTLVDIDPRDATNGIRTVVLTPQAVETKSDASPARKR